MLVCIDKQGIGVSKKEKQNLPQLKYSQKLVLTMPFAHSALKSARQKTSVIPK